MLAAADSIGLRRWQRRPQRWRTAGPGRRPRPNARDFAQVAPASPDRDSRSAGRTGIERSLKRNPLEAILERALVQEQLGPLRRRGRGGARAIPCRTDRLARRRLCDVRCYATSADMDRASSRRVRTFGSWLLDFALPPRCAGCGTIVADVHSFCTDCWKQIEFLGSGGCETCGLPLQATEADDCAVCLAMPPRIRRTRAAVAYDELSRSLALRLKYGRKVAVAKTMARYMAPLIAELAADALLVPGSACIARGCGSAGSTSRRSSRASCRERPGSRPSSCDALRRIKRTPPLKGMSLLQRRRIGRRRIQGRAIRAALEGQDGGPGRRRADHRKHRQCLRAGAAAGRRGAGRADQLGARGAAFAVDALKPGERFREDGPQVPKVEIYVKMTCPYCCRAKHLLDSKGIEYQEHRGRFRRAAEAGDDPARGRPDDRPADLHRRAAISAAATI